MAVHLRIATLNIWALPYGLARHTAARVEAIGARLASLGADLIALQEVWTDRASAQLVVAGRGAGLPYVWRPARARGGSGLLLLSRLPLEQPRFRGYALRGLPQNIHHGDYYGGKGFVLARVPTRLGPVAIVTTHLHAQYAPDVADPYRGHRTGQVVELAVALQRVTDPVLAAGDFNIREHKAEYRVLVGLTGLRDLAAELDRRQPTAFEANPYRGRAQRGDQRIDYLFARDGTQAAVRPLRVERIFDEGLVFEGEGGAYSDHAGVFSEVELVGRAPAPSPAPDPEAIDLAAALLDSGRRRAQERRVLERAGAAAAAAAGVAALAARRWPVVARRTLLRRGLTTFAAVALPFSAGSAGLSEVFVPEELAAYDRVATELETLR